MTGRRLASLAFPLALLLFAASCGGSDTSDAASEDAGSSAEGVAAADSDAPEDGAASDGSDAGTEVAALAGLDGEFATIDGASIDLATLQGEDVVLWFWAPW